MLEIAWLAADARALASAGFYILLAGRPVIGPFVRETDAHAVIPHWLARRLAPPRGRADAEEDAAASGRQQPRAAVL
jgi:hypothetical protein